MKRRAVIGGLSAGLLLGGAAWLRPADRGAPHNRYFSELNRILKRDGPAKPCLVLDLDRYNHNLIALRRALPPGKAFRIVSKSLPSLRLLQHSLAAMQSQRVMSFHEPYTRHICEEMPESDILLGKPMPVRAAATYYRRHRSQSFDPQRQLQWLIDSPERLQEYAGLAEAQGLHMRINIEIDVGLHRGGVAEPAGLVAMLDLLRQHRQRLRFSGFMGYDPHVVKLPGLLGSPEALQQKANARYEAFIDVLREQGSDLLLGDQDQPLVFNGAGSPNFVLHDERAPTNDLAIGSALVKPLDFELPTLEAFQPALYIATPVLKKRPGAVLPGIEWTAPPVRLWNPNRRQAYFIYGGNWLAEPASPAGLAPNPLFGRSSNQELLEASPVTGLAVGDYLFLRPTQSEALMLQFGPLVVVQAGAIIDYWPVFTTA